jgi:C4-dicarboxylate-specific signal transduction histidine kinase
VAVVSSDHQIIEVLELQTLLLCVVLTGLVLGVVVDEWRDASQRLARARQLTAVGEMATALAHELNQPLTALSTYSDAMRLMAEAAPTEQAAMIATADRIRRVATRCADIVARFRALAPNRASHAERTAIAAVVESALAALHERIERSGARVQLDVEPDLPALPVDRERMSFVFQNLVANALDAARAEPPAVRIVIRRDGHRHVRATLRDSGPGIPAEMTEQIFEPFFTEKAHGMGLGLAICRSIVESHGGRLWAEPDAHGVLHVRLPA